MDKKFLDLSGLSHFLDNLKTLFANLNHTHTINEVETLSSSISNIQSDIDNLEDTVANLSTNSQYTIRPITQDEYDALTSVDENTLYIIEV